MGLLGTVLSEHPGELICDVLGFAKAKRDDGAVRSTVRGHELLLLGSVWRVVAMMKCFRRFPTGNNVMYVKMIYAL